MRRDQNAEARRPIAYLLLPVALDVLWSALRFRPLRRPQWQWFERYLTGPAAERVVAERLNCTGPLSLPVALPEGVHQLHIQWWTAPGGAQ
ncbi:hypothetical protein J5Y04_06530 [Kitasatospora sp. RG8]|uniref:hypothetical protein n=1 Tax=Kitasatospora sp. RG8 TaxID=2820815 RepID=UPI001AE06E16|nr:hypothetical protein [Kitasatospora sp. RG8]MBP0449203.1 hypothetical protein [Kitasatospora sp. RG8]